MAGLRVSESTVQRTSEAAGRRHRRRWPQAKDLRRGPAWAWHKDAEGKTCAYVSLDLTGLGMQGPGGAAAEGRMTAVGMVYNPVPEDAASGPSRTGGGPQFQARYVAGLEGQAALAEPLRKQAGQVGMDRAERWIALCDARLGAGGPAAGAISARVEAVILDFYHATEHLGDLGPALYPGDEAAREEWIEQWCHRLKHEGGQAVLEGLRGLDLAGIREAVRRGEEVVRLLREPGAIGWTIRATGPRGGRSARARWNRRARRSSASG